MYVYQEGKLYVLIGENSLIGVDVSPYGILKVDGTECELRKNYQLLTYQDVQLKFNVIGGGSYMFPAPQVEPKETEVVANESTEPVQKPVRKSSRK